MKQNKQNGTGTSPDHGGPVPKFLLLVYLVIAVFFVYYLFTGLKFGAGSPTGF